MKKNLQKTWKYVQIYFTKADSAPFILSTSDQSASEQPCYWSYCCTVGITCQFLTYDIDPWYHNNVRRLVLLQIHLKWTSLKLDTCHLLRLIDNSKVVTKLGKKPNFKIHATFAAWEGWKKLSIGAPAASCCSTESTHNLIWLCQYRDQNIEYHTTVCQSITHIYQYTSKSPPKQTFNLTNSFRKKRMTNPWHWQWPKI